MLEKLEDVERRYHELERSLLAPEVLSSPKEYARLSKERANLEPLVGLYQEWKRVRNEIEGHKELLDSDDEELRELAKAELPALRERLQQIELDLRKLLLPRDPNDERNVVLEIRAATGGDEATLFAADLFRMYTRYAERQGWRVEILSASPSDIGGFKEVIALIEGRLQPPQVRGRRASRATDPENGGGRPHPHLHRYRGRAAGGGRSRSGH